MALQRREGDAAGLRVLFATGITLVLVPVVYYVLEDVKALARRIFLGGGDEGVAVAQEA